MTDQPALMYVDSYVVCILYTHQVHYVTHPKLCVI